MFHFLVNNAWVAHQSFKVWSRLTERFSFSEVTFHSLFICFHSYIECTNTIDYPHRAEEIHLCHCALSTLSVWTWHLLLGINMIRLRRFTDGDQKKDASYFFLQCQYFCIRITDTQNRFNTGKIYQEKPTCSVGRSNFIEMIWISEVHASLWNYFTIYPYVITPWHLTYLDELIKKKNIMWRYCVLLELSVVYEPL